MNVTLLIKIGTHANRTHLVFRILKQVAALPFSISPEGAIRLWLVTTRNRRHWIVPKGNVDEGWTPHEAAAQEAREEAGLIGTIGRDCIGTFAYRKRKAEGPVFIDIDVYSLQVDSQLKDWPERGEREVLCCSLATALSLITVPGLIEVIEKVFGPNSFQPDAEPGLGTRALDPT